MFSLTLHNWSRIILKVPTNASKRGQPLYKGPVPYVPFASNSNTAARPTETLI